ncbi:MAG: response regulator [Bacteroidia bacterium]
MQYKNILLIDDDDGSHEIFLSAVSEISNSANCVTLSSAIDALQKLNSKNITPDVIFVDLNMPVMNGQQFLIEIKKSEMLKNIPVIIFSTSSHPTTISHTKEFGASDFITKPARYHELVEILSPMIVS